MYLFHCTRSELKFNLGLAVIKHSAFSEFFIQPGKNREIDFFKPGKLRTKLVHML